MKARVSRVTMFVMLTCCLFVAGTRTAAAQLLCPAAGVGSFREGDVWGFNAGSLYGPGPRTFEADLHALGGMLPEGAWHIPISVALDGLVLEGVSFTRNAKPHFGSTSHFFDVVVDLRSLDNVVTDLELVLIDGERRLRLGEFKGIVVRCEATSVSRTFSIPDRDFTSFFSGSRAPTLHIKRTTRADGC